MDLAEFLLARIAEDEAAARAMRASDERWTWDPAFILAECEAKRRIVEAFAAPDHGRPDDIQLLDDDAYVALKWVVRVLALPYADHPDYDEAWAVEASTSA